LAWNLINTSAWLKVSSNGGILAVDSSTSVTASLNVAASNLAAGNYTAGLKFTNQNSHVVQDIPFSLNIVQSLVQNGGFETGDFTGWTLAGNTTVFTPFGTTVYNAVENLTNLARFWGTFNWQPFRKRWQPSRENNIYCPFGSTTQLTAASNNSKWIGTEAIFTALPILRRFYGPTCNLSSPLPISILCFNLARKTTWPILVWMTSV
jgi:hypothetical protein